MSSEKIIQNALHQWRTERGHPFIAPNVTMPSGEMDLISISKSGFVHEHEIKISRADFRADFKHKDEKHVWLRDAKKLKGRCVRHIELEKKYKYSDIRLCANNFFYVVPENLIAVEDVPSYAGLAYWQPNTQGFTRLWQFGRIKVVKEAPRLHSEKISKERMEKLAISMMYRYWNYRLKEIEQTIAGI